MTGPLKVLKQYHGNGDGGYSAENQQEQVPVLPHHGQYPCARGAWHRTRYIFQRLPVEGNLPFLRHCNCNYLNHPGAGAQIQYTDRLKNRSGWSRPGRYFV